MRTLKFHGYSDDTFGEYGITNLGAGKVTNNTNMSGANPLHINRQAM